MPRSRAEAERMSLRVAVLRSGLNDRLLQCFQIAHAASNSASHSLLRPSWTKIKCAK